MRGHEALQAMRRRGIRPVIAAISDGLDGIECWRDWPDWSPMAHIEIQPTDSLQRLDLRCLVGMTVWVSSTDEDRLAALFAACVGAGAASVSAGLMAWQRGELVRVDGFETLEAA